MVSQPRYYLVEGAEMEGADATELGVVVTLSDRTRRQRPHGAEPRLKYPRST